MVASTILVKRPLPDTVERHCKQTRLCGATPRMGCFRRSTLHQLSLAKKKKSTTGCTLQRMFRLGGHLAWELSLRGSGNEDLKLSVWARCLEVLVIQDNLQESTRCSQEKCLIREEPWTASQGWSPRSELLERDTICGWCWVTVFKHLYLLPGPLSFCFCFVLF